MQHIDRAIWGMPLNVNVNVEQAAPALAAAKVEAAPRQDPTRSRM
jgi:hypothetical protein